MAKLTGQTIADSYDQLLIVDHADGISSSLQAIESADTGGSTSALQISTTSICVDNPTASAADQGGILRLQSDDGAVMAQGHRLGVIDFGGAEDTSNTISAGAQIAVFASQTWGGSANGAYMTFSTNADSTVDPDERMRISSDGHVGIGTIDSYYTGPTSETAQKALLHIHATGGDGWQAVLNLSGGDGTDNSYAGQIQWSEGEDVDDRIATIAGRAEGTHANPGGSLEFSTAKVGDVDSGALTQAMCINESQNVGIGTTSPSNLLQVGHNVSGVNSVIEISANTDALAVLELSVNSTAKWGLQNSAADQIQVYDHADSSVAMHCDTTEEAWGTGSDSRIKENVSNIDSVLTKLNSLNPITYQRKYSKSDRYYAGLVAQEVLPNFPLVVTGSEDTFKEIPAKDAVFDADGNVIEEATSLTYEGGLSLKYASFVPYLIKAIQELSAKVTALENA